MEIVLLSGGSGKRLWPLSNDNRSKQFLKVLKHNNEYESMVQRVYRQINETLKDVNITISTSISQKAILEKQLNNNVDIVCEPSRRNTFPAILLAAAHLYLNKNVDLNDTITILPIDSYVENTYFENLLKMDEIIKNNKANICLLGIKPTYPSEKYGYIIKKNKIEFKEKPNKELASEYINQGALWNGGVFCLKLSYLIDYLKKYIEFNNFEDVINNFDKLEKTSFDYAVLEKESSIDVIEYNGCWKDLGTWNTLTEEIEDKIGKVITSEDCINTSVVNELNIPVVALGLKDIVVATSPDGILVSNKEKSSYLNNYLDQVTDRIKYEERIWGKYVVLEETDKKLVKTLYIDKGKNISYQKHTYRDEVWTVVSGKGLFVLDNEIKDVKENDVLFIPKGTKHAIKAITDLELVEVQLGKNFVEDDIERYEYNWDEI